MICNVCDPNTTDDILSKCSPLSINQELAYFLDLLTLSPPRRVLKTLLFEEMTLRQRYPLIIMRCCNRFHCIAYHSSHPQKQHWILVISDHGIVYAAAGASNTLHTNGRILHLFKSKSDNMTALINPTKLSRNSFFAYLNTI